MWRDSQRIPKCHWFYLYNRMWYIIKPTYRDFTQSGTSNCSEYCCVVVEMDSHQREDALHTTLCDHVCQHLR